MMTYYKDMMVCYESRHYYYRNTHLYRDGAGIPYI